jgi:hypothetical protein
MKKLALPTRAAGLARALALSLSFSTVVAACAHAPAGGAVAFRVEANVADATVWIDDVLVGRAVEWRADGKGVRHIRAGFHRVEIRAPGYYSVYREVEQPDGGRVVVRAELRPLLD